jgi:hypothetical protein
MHTLFPCVPDDLDNLFDLVDTSVIELLNTWRSGPYVGWILYEWTMLVADIVLKLGLRLQFDSVTHEFGLGLIQTDPISMTLLKKIHKIIKF